MKSKGLVNAKVHAVLCPGSHFITKKRVTFVGFFQNRFF